jgi:hypothetical protein
MMDLTEAFNQPFDPNSSIQLNNKYWSSDKYTLLNLLKDCEASLSEQGIRSRSAPLIHLKKLFPKEIYYQKMIKRLGKLLCFQSNFGHMIQSVPVSRSLIEKVSYSGDQDAFYMPLPRDEEFKKLSQEVRGLYHAEYGWDFSILHKTMRYARSSATMQKAMNFGPMSDYHNDELKGITCVIYLSEVKRENGAFSFIQGSECIPRSSILIAIHQTVCFNMGLTMPEQMVCLPLEFRSTPIIGNFLESEKIDALLENETVLEGGAGRAIIFNGQRVIHRGGKPVSGSRYAAFLAMEGMVIHKVRSFISQISH